MNPISKKLFIAASIILPIIFIIVSTTFYHRQFATIPNENGIHEIKSSDHQIYELKGGWNYAFKEHDHSSIPEIPFKLNASQSIELSTTIQLNEIDKFFGIYLEGLHQPYTLKINGETIHSMRKPNASKLLPIYVEEKTLQLSIVIEPSEDQIALLKPPVFGALNDMQLFINKQFIVIVVTLMCLLFLAVYTFTLYLANQRRRLHLQMSTYFIFVAISLFLSHEGLGLLYFNLSDLFFLKLKTVFGLLSAIPLFFIVQNLTGASERKINLYYFIPIILGTLIVLIAPMDFYKHIELAIWVGLASLLLLQIFKLAALLIRSKRLSLKKILLINTLVYLFIYIALRITYHFAAVNIQTTYWLLVFAISICLYLMLYQGELMNELALSKQEAIATKFSFFNAQIKPHFLYNALSNIMALCYTDNLKAARLLGKFSTYLRIIFDNDVKQEWMTLEKELALIDAYVEIEQARFPNKINYVLSMEGHLKAITIPTLTIQPFVENAIRHGIFNKDDGGTVRLTIKQLINELLIIIEDDGVGISEEHLQHINSGTLHNQGIGISNVIERLSYIENSSFNISSTPGKGTTIQIILPIHSF